MQEGNYIGKIGLVIAHKQHIAMRQPLNMLTPFNFNAVKNYQSRVGNNAYKCINKGPNDTQVLQSFCQTHTNLIYSRQGGVAKIANKVNI